MKHDSKNLEQFMDPISKQAWIQIMDYISEQT